jgi:DNA repair protein RecO (recombination protein O)
MEESLAILIRRQPWSDTSWIVTWLTRTHGKISTMARGARRPSSPHAGKLDLFFTADIGFAISRKSQLHSLREVRVLEPFDATSCANVFLAGYFAELSDLITQPGDPVEPVFDLLSRALAFLRRSPASLRALEHFEGELARALGIAHHHPLPALESYCGRIPASRTAALKFLSQDIFLSSKDLAEARD